MEERENGKDTMGAGRRDDRRGDRRDTRGGRRRERRGGRERDRGRDRGKRDERPMREKQQDGSLPIKSPIILTKPKADKMLQEANKEQQTPQPVVIAIQKREDSNPATPSSLLSSISSTPKAVSTDHGSRSRTKEHLSSQSEERPDQLTLGLPAATPPSIPTSTVTLHSSSSDHIVTGVGSLRLTVKDSLHHAVQVADENFHWNDKALEALLEQTDFIVVGVVGLQGSGKSTVSSMIGKDCDPLSKSKYIFKPQTKHNMEKSMHRTEGLDLFISSERLIILDTQPLLSPSILDQFLRHDRKVPSDFGTAETCIEMQSLHLLTFLYTVCHVVIVVLDNFTDLSLLRLLKTAEMLKPSTVAQSSQDGGGGSNPEDYDEYFPHLVFVHNRCSRENVLPESLEEMCEVTQKVFEHSRLKVRGSASILRSNLLPFSKLKPFYNYQDLNLFLLPDIDDDDSTSDNSNVKIFSTYRGHPSFTSLTATLRNQIVSMPRQHLTHHPLTERNWFHYAARTWEAIKKSPLLSEYQRLLTS